MKFTIESTFTVPHYRHTTYEAASLEEACRMAMADDDWESQEKDYDSSGPEHITGAWEGEDSAYSGTALPIPAEHTAPDLLAALKIAKTILDGVVHPACRKPGDGLAQIEAALRKAEPQPATSRPGDMAAMYMEETGVDYATALVRCNID